MSLFLIPFFFILLTSAEIQHLHHKPKEVNNMSSVKSSLCPSSVLQWQSYVEHWSRQTGIPTALGLAVIDQESDGRASVSRQEASYLKELLTTSEGAVKIRRIQKETGLSEKEIVTSYGLMQPLFTLAYGYGARSKEDLYDPNKNIRYCMSHLSVLAKKHLKHGEKKFSDAHIRRIAARYNGCGEEDSYARDVLALYKKYTSYLTKGV